jgi:signal transduction histidine kinase/CheY-like chemotaxis protein
VVVLRATRRWSTRVVEAAVLLAPAAVALGAHAAWPRLPPGVLALLFLLTAAAAGALRAAGRARRAPPAPWAGANLLARQLAVSAREYEASRFQRFARDAPIGILFFGHDGAISFANDELLRITGRSREAFDRERSGPGGEERLRWLQPELGPRHEGEYVREDGTRVPILVVLSTQEDGAAAFVLDLSAEKALQRSREESEARLRASAERLAEADRRKDEFLGMLSHELRNPLAPIRNSTFLLRRSAGADPVLRERALGIVERQVEHLSRLVDDLLDVTRITRGKVELRRERVDLAGLLVRTAEDHVDLARARGVELGVDVPGRPVVIEGDPTRLMQVVGNLLQNAVKFSSAGGRVSLTLEEHPEAAEIRVRDDGAGIDPALLEHVFEPFVQGERTLARSGGGLGIGLALVKALAEMHGGRVQAASAGAGRGAEFRVSLPLPAPEPPRERVPGPPPVNGVVPHRARVLVVDDNRDVAESLRDLVEAFGHEVQVARSGDAALAQARQNPPDVVLCDIGLPGMTGYDVARAFRRDPALRHARLVAVTGYAQAEDRREAAEAGFDRHVGKPPDPSELEQLLG